MPRTSQYVEPEWNDVRSQIISIMNEKRFGPFQVAKHSGVPRSCLSKYLKGEQTMTVDNLVRVAISLGCKVEIIKE